MPHITKISERLTLVKSEYNDWSMDLERKYKSPPAISTERPWLDARYPTETLFQIIEDLIEKTLPQVEDKFFNTFVDVKEVPYGRDNSNTNY